MTEEKEGSTEDGGAKAVIKLMWTVFPYVLFVALLISAFQAGRYYQPVVDSYNDAQEVMSKAEQVKT